MLEGLGATCRLIPCPFFGTLSCGQDAKTTKLGTLNTGDGMSLQVPWMIEILHELMYLNPMVV